MVISKETLVGDLNKIREQSPLVHNITNYVVMNNTANALLAIGASPVMAHAKEEVEDMVAISSALVINMGTLSKKWVEAMLLAGAAAHKKEIPVVFDPVGVGATPYRNRVAAQIVEECKPSIIRGNASEIMSLAKEDVVTKGVDSTASSNTALDAAKRLARQTGAVVVISGAKDYITDGKVVHIVNNGSPLMPKVTGMGCTASAIIGAFAAVNSNYMEAATNAMAVMSVTGELAASKSEGPGTMQLHFLDELYKLSGEILFKQVDFE
jgi:hydroxyethylthiazole kinase